MTTKTIAELIADLLAANLRLADATAALAQARSAECAALNDVNVLQKQIEAQFVDMRKGSPQGTDWHRATHVTKWSAAP